ncbi:MAG: Mur ligase domain-containing protein, partial [Acidimicrobiia bacterium]
MVDPPRDAPADGLLGDLPANLVVDVVGTVPANVVDLTHDSRQVRPGWAFACVPGDHHDGHDFAATAVAAGAVLLLVERRLPTETVGDTAQVVCTEVRRAMGHAAASVHGHPARSLTIVGVTGTNGKTTTTHFVASILRAAERRSQVLGTLSGVRTTPEAP